MAYTVSIDKRSVHGDERVLHLSVTPDAATGNVNTGLQNIYGVAWAAASAASSSQHIRKNVLTAGTAAAGWIGISGVASGDEYAITVWGK